MRRHVFRAGEEPQQHLRRQLLHLPCVGAEITPGFKPPRPSAAPETSVVGDVKFGVGILILESSWGCLNVQSRLTALA